MKLLFTVVVLTTKVSSITASCPDNMEPSFCQSNDFIPQLYCPFVEQESQWTCTKRSQGKCVCPAPLHRRKDGSCVPRHQCDDATKGDENIPDEPPPKKIANSHYEIPDDLQGSEEDFVNLQKFIKSDKAIYPLTVTRRKLPYALKGYCTCLKSAFIQETASGALRTLDCYKDVQLMQAHYSVMMKQSEAELEARSDYGRMEVVLKVHDNGRSPTTTNEYELRETFIVLDVTDDCLLLQYGSWTEELHCMIWVFHIDGMKQTRCYKNMPENCRIDIEDVCGVRGSRKGSDAEEGTRLPKEVAHPTTTKDVLAFLQNAEAIHLQMMGLEEWMNSTCECVKSELLPKHAYGPTRTMECYTHTKTLIASETQNTIIKEQMTKIEETVYFLTRDNGGMTKVALKTMLGGAPSNEPPEQFPHEYLVLAAQTDCLLVSYGESSNGKQNCLLWGLSREEVNTNTECYKKLELLCAEDTYDTTETDNPCEHYDENEPKR